MNCKNAQSGCHFKLTSRRTDLDLTDLVQSQSKEVNGIIDKCSVGVQVAILGSRLQNLYHRHSRSEQISYKVFVPCESFLPS